MRFPQKKETSGPLLIKLGLVMAFVGLIFITHDDWIFRSFLIGGITLAILGGVYIAKGL